MTNAENHMLLVFIDSECVMEKQAMWMMKLSEIRCGHRYFSVKSYVYEVTEVTEVMNVTMTTIRQHFLECFSISLKAIPKLRFLQSCLA